MADERGWGEQDRLSSHVGECWNDPWRVEKPLRLVDPFRNAMPVQPSDVLDDRSQKCVPGCACQRRWIPQRTCLKARWKLVELPGQVMHQRPVADHVVRGIPHDLAVIGHPD